MTENDKFVHRCIGGVGVCDGFSFPNNHDTLPSRNCVGDGGMDCGRAFTLDSF